MGQSYGNLMNDVGPHPVDDRPPDEDAAGLAPGKEIRSAETTDSGRWNVIHVLRS